MVIDLHIYIYIIIIYYILFIYFILYYIYTYIFRCWNPLSKGNVVENKNQELECPDPLWFGVRGTLLKVNGCHCSTVFVHYSNAKQVNFNQRSASAAQTGDTPLSEYVHQISHVLLK